ncbi:MAG: type I restriction enzyme S subunit [Planctomycetota bacterium]|nr:MAG: type I restriction enzyme S subunit [Planctomycetota bacterium]
MSVRSKPNREGEWAPARGYAEPERDGSELPEGWASTNVATVIDDCQPGFASGDKNVEDGVSHLRMNNIGLLGELILDLVRTVPEKLAKPQHELQRGDVLVCTTNSAKLVGKCAIFDLEGRYAFSNHLTRLRPNRDAIDHSYLRWCLWSLWKAGTFDDKCKHWVNQSTIPKDALLEAGIPLPPLAEQRRIVGKLELLLEKVSSSQQRMSRVPGLLKRFRQSVLAAACSGKLTADWREVNEATETAAEFVLRVQDERREEFGRQTELAKKSGERKPKKRMNESAAQIEEPRNGLPSTWCTTRIGDVCECLDYMRIPINRAARQTRSGSIPYYGANGQVGWIDTHLFDEDLVLVVEDESFIGREKPFSYVVRGKCWVNNHAHVLRPLGGMPADFLNICLAYFDFVPLTSGTTGRRSASRRKAVRVRGPDRVPAEAGASARRPPHAVALGQSLPRRTRPHRTRPRHPRRTRLRTHQRVA